MRVIQTKVYQIAEHPNKNKCYEWIRNNWHDLNDHTLREFIGSLKTLHKEIGGELDYSISATPDRGEYISFTGFDKDALNAIDESDCPLTGVTWDIDVIEGIRNGRPNSILKALHKQTEYVYSDEGLKELCEANEYEFTENGGFFSE